MHSVGKNHRVKDRRSSHGLPVVRWLQVGAATAGMGIALAAAPAVAVADEGASSAISGSGSSRNSSASDADNSGHSVAATETSDLGGAQDQSRSPVADETEADTSGIDEATADPADGDAAQADESSLGEGDSEGSDTDKIVMAVTVQPSNAEPETALPGPETADPPAPHREPAATIVRSGVGATSVTSVTEGSTAPVTAPAASITASPQFDPFGQFAAFFGLPGASATSAPSRGAFSIELRLNLEDLFSGTGPPAVSDPTAVVTGLFNQVLRVDPTSSELQNYLRILRFRGVNGVVAGLYSSTAFRQSQVNNYYLELLGRNATKQELDWGTTRLMWGAPEPQFAASIAGSTDFYQASSAQGGSVGVQPSAFTYVANLYRSLLGTPADPAVASAYIQRLQAGMSIGLAAREFVTADAFRQVKVQEIYAVLGQTATQAEIASAVHDWFRNGGLAGIATSLMATSGNVTRMEAGQVVLPDMVAAAQLQQLLLSAYTDTPEGFVKTLNSLLNVSEDSPCTPTSTTCNQALYALLTTGGGDRGLPNSALTITYLNSNVANLVPTQNEIDLEKSLKFPLQSPAQLATFFAGGVITPFGNPVVTSDGGNYIVDGHHRWSGIYLINPFTEVSSVDIGYVPNPQVGLKQTQIGISAQLGYLKVSQGGGLNVYNVDRAVFDTAVAGWITSGAEKEAVLAVFRQNLGIPDTATEDEQLVAIENYLWTNVQRMRNLNPYIPGATNRDVMPQAEPLQPILAYLGSGLLSYSFPIISYLG